MKKPSPKNPPHCFIFFILILTVLIFQGCGGEEEQEADQLPHVPDQRELLVGSWNRYSNKIYTLLILKNNGNWSSDLRIEGGASKIVERRGNATGTWIVEENNLILTVIDSQIEDVWKKNSTYTLEIIELDKKQMTLKYPNARLFTWKRSRAAKEAKGEESTAPVLPMKPLVVNLNKLSSNDKDRYLCLAIDLHLEALTAEQEAPKLHPKVWDAANIYLSSLIYKDVKTFDNMKVVNEKLFDIFTPYLDGKLSHIEVNHVMISSNMEKVEEFILEHTPPPPALPAEGEGEQENSTK